MDKLVYGGKVAVIGLLIVFVGLIIIILCLKIMSAVFKRIEKRKLQTETPAPAAPEPEPVAETKIEEIAASTDENELIAVIAAVITAFIGSETPLRIKSVRKVNGWKNAARSEQIIKF